MLAGLGLNGAGYHFSPQIQILMETVVTNLTNS